MSAPPRVPHWRDLALEPGGRSLVEASAGTGKTWTIGVLWWRLLLEPAQSPGVRGIVVTTFTEAAAQELRERLRARLQQALRLAATPPGAGETMAGDEAWLCARWEDDPARQAEDLRRLRLALADFDRAPIGTETEVIEDWLRQVGEMQETAHGLSVVLTTELLREYAEWVAACQRECIAQVLERMPDGYWANNCADAVRQMRAQH